MAAAAAALLQAPAAQAAVTVRIQSKPKLKPASIKAGYLISVPDSYSVAYDRSDGPEEGTKWFGGNFKTFETLSISKVPLASLGLEALEGECAEGGGRRAAGGVWRPAAAGFLLHMQGGLPLASCCRQALMDCGAWSCACVAVAVRSHPQPTKRISMFHVCAAHKNRPRRPRRPGARRGGRQAAGRRARERERVGQREL